MKLTFKINARYLYSNKIIINLDNLYFNTFLTKERVCLKYVVSYDFYHPPLVSTRWSEKFIPSNDQTFPDASQSPCPNANKEGDTKEERIFSLQEENPSFSKPSTSICIEPWWIKIIKKFNQPLHFLLLPPNISCSPPPPISLPTMFSGAMRNIGSRFSRKDVSEEN